MDLIGKYAFAKIEDTTRKYLCERCEKGYAIVDFWIPNSFFGLTQETSYCEKCLTQVLKNITQKITQK